MWVAAFTSIAALFGLSHVADGASLRTHAQALDALRAREAEGKTPKTAFDGSKFHSILDHPSTSRFFEGKGEAEIIDMVESTVFAHFVGHGHALHKKKKARTSEAELAGTSFVQLAAAHGVDFATLQRLHQKSGKGHHDMEVWWREQALHPSVHLGGHEAAVEFEDELHASRNPLELSFMEMFQAEKAKKKARAATMATTTNSAAKEAFATPKMHASPTQHAEAKEAFALGRIAGATQHAESDTKTPLPDDSASDTAFLSEKTSASERKSASQNTLLDKMSTWSEAKIRSHLKVKVGNALGDTCFRSCDDGSPCTSHKCTYRAGTRNGNTHCYCNVDCASGTCKFVSPPLSTSRPPNRHFSLMGIFSPILFF